MTQPPAKHAWTRRFELAVEGEIRHVHARIPNLLQPGQPWNQMVPHGDGHILQAKGRPQRRRLVPAAIEPFHSLDIRSGAGFHGRVHRLMHVDADRPEEVPVQQFVAMFDDAVAKFRVEDFRQLIGHGLIFSVD